VAAFALSACSTDTPQSVLQPQGEFARKADALWDITFAIAIAVFVVVQGLLLYAIFRYRHKPGREAAQFHGNTRLEIAMTIIPALILLGLAIPTVATVFDLAAEPTGADVIHISVEGRQFWWRYDYTDLDIVTANELHIPTGQPIDLSIEGYDVNHSFWVPRLGGTQDVVPGRTSRLTLEADDPGTYLGQCKEFCGLSHSNMNLRVIAHDPGDFEQWVSDQQEPAAAPSDSLAAEGAELFVNGAADAQFAGGPSCASCHAIEGLDGAVGIIGPNLTHFAARNTFAGAIFQNNESNLRAWLANPPERKPGSQMPNLQLTTGQIDALVAYLQTLE